MSGAKDPDEFIKLKGADAFRNLLEGSEDQVDYRLHAVTAKYDLSADEQKVEFLKEATELVARLPGAVERQVYAMRVASLSGVAADAVTAEVERRRKRLLSGAQRANAREQSRPERQTQPVEKEFRYENPGSAVAEEGVIRLLYLEPELANMPELPPPERFSAPVLGRIYSAILDRLRRGDSVSAATLGDSLSGDEVSLLVSILQKPELLSQGERTMRDYINKINNEAELAAGSSDLRALANKLREKKGYEG